MLKRFDGKVAIVTGAGSGIGRATALRLAAEGASVGVADINGEGAASVTKEITDQGGRALQLVADVSDEAAVEEMIERTVRELGGLDVLHNNAGLLARDVLARDGEIANFERAIFDRAVGVNLLGPIFGCKYAIPKMIERGGGAIVNTASIAALAGSETLPIYGMTKAAVVALTMYVAAQYGKQGIRCNAVAPGSILTPSAAANRTEEQTMASLGFTLTPRLGNPEDIAAAVAYLASDEAGYLTAQTLVVDGGKLSHWH